MKLGNILFGVIAVVVMAGTAACKNRRSERKEAAPRPNIIYIMSDDHGYQALSCYNGALNRTPNLDRIAGEGVMFTRAFVTNSLCAPSRAVLLTGKFSNKNICMGIPSPIRNISDSKKSNSLYVSTNHKI